MVYAINELLANGGTFTKALELAQSFVETYGPSYSVPGLLATSNAPKFHCSVINTWNGGDGGRVSKFTSESTDVAGFNECWQWIQKNTSFSFSEAIENQGYEIEYSDYRNDLCEYCDTRACTEEHPEECDHEIVWDSLIAADSCDGIVDLSCGLCGASGSAQIEYNDIQW